MITTHYFRHVEKQGAAMGTVLAHPTQEDTTVSEVVQTLDVDLVLKGMQATSRVVGPNDFIRKLMEMFGYSYDFARDIVFGLIELGRASLTTSFNLRFEE